MSTMHKGLLYVVTASAFAALGLAIYDHVQMARAAAAAATH